MSNQVQNRKDLEPPPMYTEPGHDLIKNHHRPRTITDFADRLKEILGRV